VRESLRFKDHYNHALGKRIHTKEDYLKEIKKHNLEPVKSDQVDHKFKKKSYSGVSEDARRMMNSVSYDRKTGKPNIGDRYIEKLKSMGVKQIPNELRNKMTGGSY